MYFKLISLIIMYTEMQIFIHVSHSKMFLKVGNYARYQSMHKVEKRLLATLEIAW